MGAILGVETAVPCGVLAAVPPKHKSLQGKKRGHRRHGKRDMGGTEEQRKGSECWLGRRRERCEPNSTWEGASLCLGCWCPPPVGGGELASEEGKG